MELQTYSNPVDSQDVPVSYFGVALNMNDWEDLAQRVIYIKFTL
jgi:extradiol dioxygenase family protein|tara:strand:- start:446 stop:577 length:132 start_codon:yes stop_codon:yes gene_type:complete